MRSVPLLAAVVLALVGAAPATAAPPASCAGTGSIAPTKVLTGSFSTARQGSYVMLPVTVPRGVTQFRVRYCWDEPETAGAPSHTLDLGVYDALRKGDRVWGSREFRGWGGSSHPEVALSRQGFSTRKAYLADPKGYVPGRTTRGFEPGAIRPGRWAVELGVAAVTPKSAGDATGEVGWRVEVELSHKRSFAAHPYKPARYHRAAVRGKAGWYAGDFHVHDEHSNLGAATISETLAYAFRPLAQGGAGLDFTALSDYVTDTAWGEIGRYQRRYPRNLVIPSAEVITYRGHLANQNAGGWADYRTGPIVERTASGALKRLRGPTPPRQVFAAIHRLGGFTVVNHPRIFPPTSAALAALCRGCYWSYTDAQTGFGRVDAIEVMNSLQEINGKPNPFTAAGIAYWQHALATGAHVAALGGSDTHDAGRLNGPLSSPLGRPTTMVYADELSADGVQRAVQDGHTYVKALGAGGPDLRLTARRPGSKDPAAIMGDSVNGGRARIVASVTGAPGGVARRLALQRDGRTIVSKAFTGRTASITRTTAKRGRYGIVVMRGGLVEAISSPVYVDEPRTRLRVGLSGKVRRRGDQLIVPCTGSGTDVRFCEANLRGSTAIVVGQTPLTGGRATVKLGLGRKLRHGRAKLVVRTFDRLGHPSKLLVRHLRIT